ncbi:MAG: PAS domain S-box protein [bacterium]
MFNRFRKIPIIYYAIFFTVSTVIIATGFFIFISLRRNFIKKEIENYSQTASLQSSSISKFITERMFNAYLISENDYAHSIIKNMYFSEDVTFERKKAWLSRFNKNNDYYTIALYSKSEDLIFTVFENPESLQQPSSFFFKEAMSSKSPVLGEPYLCSNCKRLHLDIFAPIIKSTGGENIPAFLILLRVDLREYIIPKINRFNPNDDVYSVILFSDSFALNIAHGIERVVFDAHTLNRIKASKDGVSFNSTFMNRSYYIMPSAIENTDWFFVSCVPVEFISDKTIIYIWAVFTVCLFIIIALFFSLYILFLADSKKAAERDLLSEKEKQTLMKHFDYLLEMADDMIFLLDNAGFIKYANKSAVSQYQNGNHSILGLNFNDIISRGFKEREMKFDFFFNSSIGDNGAVFQTEHFVKGGRLIPVEIRAKRFSMYNETYYQLIIRDISDRVAVDNDLKAKNKELFESLENLKKTNNQLKTTEQERVHHINLLMKNEKHLEEYSVKVKSIFDRLSECVIIYRTSDGENFIIADLNKTAERTEQISRERVIGKNVEEVFPGVIGFGLLEIFKKVYLTGMDIHKEASVYRDDRISGVRENFVHKLSSDEIVVIYREIKS